MSEIILKRGSKGEDVLMLQKAINHYDLIYKLKEDGDFGKVTEKALKDVQRRKRSKQTGSVTDLSFHVLFGEMLRKVNPPALTIVPKVEEVVPVKQPLYTPNYKAGYYNECLGVVVHHSDGSFEGSADWCLRKESGVSYHAMCSLTGNIITLAPDTYVAYHSGESSFKGREWCNRFMLGFSFSGTTYGRDLTQEELAAFLGWWNARKSQYGWTKDSLTTHRAVSPGRKDDISPLAEKQLIGYLIAAKAI